MYHRKELLLDSNWPAAAKQTEVPSQP